MGQKAWDLLCQSQSHPGNEHGNLLDEENRAFKTTLFTVIINLEMIGFDETRISFNNERNVKDLSYSSRIQSPDVGRYI
ncbi:hypothetical protein OUZ56_031745 [Daphnia magna]|uniref:Uncharacterized protein n=1 Tax=Daphnia magna TaxID=35525 RepID=A0ABQ9ZVU9_9CRUS|nr:hypothetical protein OUZ56_031745 [Daphnia magna]